MGQQTYDLVHDSVEVRSLGMPDLKGKAKPIEVYELIALRP
jgi:class 3 adenylate cyclase